MMTSPYKRLRRLFAVAWICLAAELCASAEQASERWVNASYVKNGAVDIGGSSAKLAVRAGPGLSFTQIDALSSGQRVTVYEHRDGWVRISDAGRLSPVQEEPEQMGLTVSLTPAEEPTTEKKSAGRIIFSVLVIAVLAAGIFLFMKRKSAKPVSPAERKTTPPPIPSPAPPPVKPSPKPSPEQASAQEPAPKPVAPAPPAPKPVSPAPAASGSRDDDPLFKHLDLLKQLKNKENP